MRLSTLFGRTLREAPADADSRAYQLLIRAGLVRQTHAGSFALLPLGLRVLRKIEAIMHAELARIQGQEFRTPVVQLAAAWQQSGRYSEYGPLILHMQDRSERDLIFAPTHEEAIAELARREVTSYRHMPALLYQLHTKYRDELRAKGGLMRMREFTMLDAYSLDADAAGLDLVYAQVANAFEQVFKRCAVQFVAVEASAGEMGGREPREYMALSPHGEDTLAICPHCGYAANIEIARARWAKPEQPTAAAAPSELVATPECKTIAELAQFMQIAETATAKAVFFDTPEHGLIFVVIRGDLEVNEAKLRAAAGVSALTPASIEQITATGAIAGYASPVGLNIQPETSDQANTTDQPVVFVIADQSIVDAGPLVAGANKTGYHLRNVLYGRDWHATRIADIALVRAGDSCVRCATPLITERGIELGHIFKLGTRFTTALGATYLDPNGVAQPIVMGSYGIGLERLLQVIVEQHHDDAGIIWPAAIAPFDVHVVRLGKSAALREASDALYTALIAAGREVLYDDREETAGVKFNDADLIGLPVRVVISERLLAADQLEIKWRGGEVQKLAHAEVLALLTNA